jgi:hypothetical protein
MRDLRGRCGGNDDHHDSDDKASAIGAGSNPVALKDQYLKLYDKTTVLAPCADAQQYNSQEGTRSLSDIPSQPDPIAQQLSSDSFHHRTRAPSPPQRKRQRTTYDDGSDEESNTYTAIEPSPQDPVVGPSPPMIPQLLTKLRGYIS